MQKECNTILKMEHVNNYYEESESLFSKRRKQVLKDISLEIKKGEIYGLVGESGCGKSTLTKAVLGLIDYDGKIIIDNVLREKKNSKDINKSLQVVFQDPAGSLNPKKKIGWILEEPLKIHKIGDKQSRRKRAEEMLDKVGLDKSLYDRFPRELSGGQKQRVCIAAALILNPKLIIADEAVSALDVSVGAQILNLFKELHDNMNLSILFISHNLNVVYYLCDKIAVMKDGEIIEKGTADEIFNNPKEEYTKELLNAIPNVYE